MIALLESLSLFDASGSLPGTPASQIQRINCIKNGRCTGHCVLKGETGNLINIAIKGEFCNRSKIEQTAEARERVRRVPVRPM
jgi:hypothetical protein